MSTTQSSISSLKLLWGGFLIAHLIIAIIGITGVAITPLIDGATPDERAVSSLSLPLYAIATLAVALMLRYMFYFKQLRAGQLANEQRRVQTYTMFSRGSFAAACVATLLGLFFSLTTGEPLYSLPFAALGVLTHIILFPKQAHLDAPTPASETSASS